MKVDLRLSHSVDVPFLYEISSDCNKDFTRLLSSPELALNSDHRVLVLTGSSATTTSLGDSYAARLNAAGVKVCCRAAVQRNSIAEVGRIDALCGQERVDLIVAVGGGKVIDVAKAVVARRTAALVVVPSALSSDCIASPVAVLTDANGVRASYPSGVASCVFIDLDVVCRNDVRFTVSGLGDILSNASALLDVEEYEAQTGKSVNGFAKVLSECAVRGVQGIDTSSICEHETIRQIASGLIMSGLAMAFAGNSLPCSGAEHLISHSIDHLRIGTGTHGLQVAVATHYCSALRDVVGARTVSEPVLQTVRSITQARSPEALGISRSEFIEAVQLAPQMRKGRITILSRGIPRRQLEKAYDFAFSSEHVN